MAAEETRPPVERIGDRWKATGSAVGYRRDEDHVTRQNERRQQEWTQMKDLIDTVDTCLMTKMRRLLDDTKLTPDDDEHGCRKCGVCLAKVTNVDIFLLLWVIWHQ